MVLSLLLAGLCAVLLWLGLVGWAGIIPVLMIYTVQAVRGIRHRQPEGLPIITLDGDTLNLYLPSHLGRVIPVELNQVQALSFYGRALSEFAVIRRDGSVERHYPAWRTTVRVQIQQFLEEELAGRVEVRQGEVPSFFEDVRGQYKP